MCKKVFSSAWQCPMSMAIWNGASIFASSIFDKAD
jgi:hypothetical protein